mmetsp:Transcript_18122/g.56230  ORF Transcript_18122/g.56230 Transcript_18122/m.56230 type:complete len:217 (+) Transcript_18122:276-926(+)
MTVSCASKPPVSASVLGMVSSDSAKAATPSLTRPLTVGLILLSRCCAAATSKAPAPGTTAPSSITFFTARRPSRTASFICAMTWSLGPLSSIVQLRPSLQSSTKVNTSSPSVCSYTHPACPRISSPISGSIWFTASPPHASTSRSMLRRLQRRSAMMPSLDSRSRLSGSMPFWLITTNVLSVPSHTFFLSAITSRTRLSVYSRSAATMLSRCSAEL